MAQTHSYDSQQSGTPATPTPALTLKTITPTPRPKTSGGTSSMPPSNQVKKIQKGQGPRQLATNPSGAPAPPGKRLPKLGK